MRYRTEISSFSELARALAENRPRELRIRGSIDCPNSILLPPGYGLSGAGGQLPALAFSNSDGLALTGDNKVANVQIITSPYRKAIYLVDGLTDQGTIKLTHLAVIGEVSLIVGRGTCKGSIEADDVDVVAADCRYQERHRKHGAAILRGAFSLCNFSDEQGEMSACLTNIRVGRKDAPVLGSGILIAGGGEKRGKIRLDLLTTGALYSDGMLETGTPDEVCAAMYIGEGVMASRVLNMDEIMAFGAEDMMLVNWGHIRNWMIFGSTFSEGLNACGIANFGNVGRFSVTS